MTDERSEILNSISDISKDANGVRDRTDYSDRSMDELRLIFNNYYRLYLENEYVEECEKRELPFTFEQVLRMNVPELEHRLRNMPKRQRKTKGKGWQLLKG